MFAYFNVPHCCETSRLLCHARQASAADIRCAGENQLPRIFQVERLLIFFVWIFHFYFLTTQQVLCNRIKSRFFTTKERSTPLELHHLLIFQLRLLWMVVKLVIWIVFQNSIAKSSVLIGYACSSGESWQIIVERSRTSWAYFSYAYKLWIMCSTTLRFCSPTSCARVQMYV